MKYLLILALGACAPVYRAPDDRPAKTDEQIQKERFIPGKRL